MKKVHSTFPKFHAYREEVFLAKVFHFIFRQIPVALNTTEGGSCLPCKS